MKNLPAYIEKFATYTVDDSLYGKLEAALFQTGLELLTTVSIMAGTFGTVSMLSGLCSTGLFQALRSAITAVTGI